MGKMITCKQVDRLAKDIRCHVSHEFSGLLCGVALCFLSMLIILGLASSFKELIGGRDPVTSHVLTRTSIPLAAFPHIALIVIDLRICRMGSEKAAGFCTDGDLSPAQDSAQNPFDFALSERMGETAGRPGERVPYWYARPRHDSVKTLVVTSNLSALGAQDFIQARIHHFPFPLRFDVNGTFVADGAMECLDQGRHEGDLTGEFTACNVSRSARGLSVNVVNQGSPGNNWNISRKFTSLNSWPQEFYVIPSDQSFSIETFEAVHVAMTSWATKNDRSLGNSDMSRVSANNNVISSQIEQLWPEGLWVSTDASARRSSIRRNIKFQASSCTGSDCLQPDRQNVRATMWEVGRWEAVLDRFQDCIAVGGCAGNPSVSRNGPITFEADLRHDVTTYLPFVVSV